MPPSRPVAGFEASVGVLANRAGTYTALVTAGGTGFSTCRGTLLTSASPAGAGLALWVRDRDDGGFWRVGADATCLHWEPGVATLTFAVAGFEATMAVAVDPDATRECRRLTLTNRSDRPRRIDVTSCAEVVLHAPAAHAAHPVFSKLFLQTAFADDVLVVRRRARDPHESTPWLAHACHGPGALSIETDRTRFIGRGFTREAPRALVESTPLSGTVGNVLDPVVSLRRILTLAPSEAATFDFVLSCGTTRAEALRLAGTDHTVNMLARARDAAVAAVSRRGASVADVATDQALAAAMLMGRRELLADADVRARVTGERGDLACLGLDPARPHAVLHADTPRGAALVPRLLGALATWRDLGLPIQLAIVGEADVATPGVVVLAPSSLGSGDRDRLEAFADLIVCDALPAVSHASEAPVARSRCSEGVRPAGPRLFDNGFGGFSSDGREYVITVAAGEDGRLRLPPQPWVNVIANDGFGCLVSETGAGTTWCGNSRENRLTPWSNDPLLDPPSEIFILHDPQTDTAFSCFPAPRPGPGSYEVRHGFGYTRCGFAGDGLRTTTLVFIHREHPVRITRVRVTNDGPEPRRLTLRAAYHLDMGDARFIVTDTDGVSGAAVARNPLAGDFSGQVAFAAVVGDEHAIAIREDIPAGAARLAHAVDLAVPPGATADVACLFGQAADVAAVRRLLEDLDSLDACDVAWQCARDFWRDGLGGLRVATPSPALDIMVNGWLGYQTLSCRIRGRTAFYQSGGAFGFRDQLQDAVALTALWPEVARAQILRNAAHQFVEGDVMHWWHPPRSRGIRTRFADDLVWLPFLTMQYVQATGDAALFDETAPYLTARALETGEDEAFLTPSVAAESGTVYDHCCRALDRALTRGAHGLPLFGSGDWNDGMNRVGREGRGESVWMGFFLAAAIDGFVSECERRGDRARAQHYHAYREDVARALDTSGWDGGWYLRGYYDDGSPLGTHRDTECRIDALVQAWSVLSGVAAPERAAQVMDAVEEHLISEPERLIRLLTPPFVDTPHDPGYIKGYVAGVRENGGQYTHAALWVVRAMATLRRRDRAAALLDLLNPVLHATTPADVAHYQVEPYVVAADVYGAAPHVGRGGWTWYTGSSGWMLRVALESILGLRVEGGDTLVLDPCVPDAWPQFAIDWRVPGSATRYRIRVTNPDACSEAVVAITVDGSPIDPVTGCLRVPLRRDGQAHAVAVTLGAAGRSTP